MSTGTIASFWVSGFCTAATAHSIGNDRAGLAAVNAALAVANLALGFVGARRGRTA